MKSETKNCQNCKAEFIIEPEDFNFYEKIKVPPPTFCPECRLIRRLAYRESRTLYKDICKKCGIKLVSIFPLESKIQVFCSKCWWGDSWEAIEYGKDYDFSKTFFQQFFELQKIVPREATGQRNSENCQYSNGNVRCKNCTLTFDCVESINCYNCQIAVYSKDSIDADSVMNVDHVYFSIACNNIYNTKFSYYSHECLDSAFLYNCLGCTQCFGCVNLRNKKYCIWNKQYSKEEYEKEIKKWSLSSYEITEKAKRKFLELYYKTPRRFALIKNSENVTGEDILNSKNCQHCFFTRLGVENCKYIFACGLLLKDSYDATFGGDKSELFYETSGGMGSQKCLFCRAGNNCQDLEYCDRLFNCSNCFGCVSLRNKSYCIFNKQYSKEEYSDLVKKIKKQMDDIPYIDKEGRNYKYGEFFPSELSLFTYNKSWGNKFFPLGKEEALRQGFNWEENPIRDYKITIQTKDLPDHIQNISDNILEEIIECEHKNVICNHECTETFKILPNELQFYRQMNLALPRLCPHCRHYERLKFVNPSKLWDRKCMKNGCSNKFKTPISPNRKEIVYCKECYQAEFI
jgi:ribosomal protein S18